jgi:hypothetical protein
MSSLINAYMSRLRSNPVATNLTTCKFNAGGVVGVTNMNRQG